MQPLPVLDEAYWYNVTSAFMVLILISLVLEQAFLVVFGNKIWKKVEGWLDQLTGGDFFDLKPWITLAVSIAIALDQSFDVIAMLLQRTEPHTLSMVVTGAFMAGGSKRIYDTLKRGRDLKDAVAQTKLKEAQQSGGRIELEAMKPEL